MKKSAVEHHRMHTNNTPVHQTVNKQILNKRPKTHGSCRLHGFNDTIVQLCSITCKIVPKTHSLFRECT